jgi:hypothetical protein
MQHARWNDALAPMDLARRELPAMQDTLAVDTLRVRRMSSDDAKSADLEAQSDVLKHLVALESGAGLHPGTDMAFYSLGRGMPGVAAKDVEENAEVDRRVLRFAAASDGATRDVVDAALALPLDEGIDDTSVWSALALALRERRDPAPYLAVIRKLDVEHSQQVLDFITAVRTSADPAQAEHLLDGLHVALRGHAYSAAVVLLGQRAPTEWRRAVNRLLFVSERPYFAGAGKGGAEVVRTMPRLR